MSKAEHLRKERYALLDRWAKASAGQRVKLLVMIMDIEDELSELEG